MTLEEYRGIPNLYKYPLYVKVKTMDKDKIFILLETTIRENTKGDTVCKIMDPLSFFQIETLLKDLIPITNPVYCSSGYPISPLGMISGAGCSSGGCSSGGCSSGGCSSSGQCKCNGSCGGGFGKCSCHDDTEEPEEITLDMNFGLEAPPIDNNGRPKCYWCKSPTVKKTLLTSAYDFCTRCKK